MTTCVVGKFPKILELAGSGYYNGKAFTIQLGIKFNYFNIDIVGGLSGNDVG